MRSENFSALEAGRCSKNALAPTTGVPTQGTSAMANSAILTRSATLAAAQPTSSVQIQTCSAFKMGFMPTLDAEEIEMTAVATVVTMGSPALTAASLEAVMQDMIVTLVLMTSLMDLT